MKPATLFLQYLESLFQKEAEIIKSDLEGDGIIAPSILIFNNVPKEGHMTAITYGLSLANHDAWMLNRKPELVLTIDTLDKDYALAIANLVATSRGLVPYLYGSQINTGKIFKNSNVSGFVIFAPKTISREFFLDIDVGLDYKICLNGIYPITDGESEIIKMIGFENFWKDDNFNLTTFRK